MMGIDKTQMTPLYYQLKQILRERIEKGELQPSQLIPSERELCEAYGISRMTVRQALTELVNEGYLHRERGKGTYVADSKIDQHLRALTSFTEDMAGRNCTVSSRVLRQELAKPTPEVATALRLSDEHNVVLLERLRLADEEPLALEKAYLHFPRCERLLTEDFSSQSLYALLRRDYNLLPKRAHQQMEAAIPDKTLVRLLELPRATAILSIRRTTYTSTGEPFEYTHSVYRGDKYLFDAELISE